MKKIFVSSTYTDLIPHRKSIWKLLKNYNAEITGMEEFGARSSAPLETCITYAEECDIYIGIIGMRYGSIEKKSRKSFTQIEYETAIKNNKEILIYLIDEINGLVKPINIDFENYRELQSFKNRLRREHTVDSFKNAKKLAEKINKRISQMVPSLFQNVSRPMTIDALITRITIAKEKWVIIVGYISGMPVELFVISEDDCYLPNWISKGKISKSQTLNRDNITRRHDLEFRDKQGNKVTSEGLYRADNEPVAIMNSIISNLLIQNTSVDVIISAIHKLDLPVIKNRDELEYGIREALSKEINDSTFIY